MDVRQQELSTDSKMGTLTRRGPARSSSLQHAELEQLKCEVHAIRMRLLDGEGRRCTFTAATAIKAGGRRATVAIELHRGVTQYDLGGPHAGQFCCMRMLSMIAGLGSGLRLPGVLERFSAWVARHADMVTEQGVQDCTQFLEAKGAVPVTLSSVMEAQSYDVLFAIVVEAGGYLSHAVPRRAPVALLRMFDDARISVWVLALDSYFSSCAWVCDLGLCWYDPHRGVTQWFATCDAFLRTALHAYSAQRQWSVYSIRARAEPDPFSSAPPPFQHLQQLEATRHDVWNRALRAYASDSAGLRHSAESLSARLDEAIQTHKRESKALHAVRHINGLDARLGFYSDTASVLC
jgi:hypothetical protein